MDAYGGILLAEPGQRIAQSSRRCAITQRLVAPGVGAQTAAGDACRMEHVLSEAPFPRISGHIKSRQAEIKESGDV